MANEADRLWPEDIERHGLAGTPPEWPTQRTSLTERVALEVLREVWNHNLHRITESGEPLLQFVAMERGALMERVAHGVNRFQGNERFQQAFAKGLNNLVDAGMIDHFTYGDRQYYSARSLRLYRRRIGEGHLAGRV